LQNIAAILGRFFHDEFMGSRPLRALDVADRMEADMAKRHPFTKTFSRKLFQIPSRRSRVGSISIISLCIIGLLSSILSEGWSPGPAMGMQAYDNRLAQRHLAVSQKIVQGDYRGALSLLNLRGGNLSAVSNFDLLHLGKVYEKLKDYQNIWRCIREMERRLKKHGDAPFIINVMWEWRCRDQVLYLKEQFFFDMGQYDRVVALFSDDDVFRYDYFNVKGARELAKDQYFYSRGVRSLFKGLVHALNGDPVEAEKHIQIIRDAEQKMWKPDTKIILKEDQLWERTHNTWWFLTGRAKIHLVLGQHKKALEAVSRAQDLARDFVKRDTKPAGRYKFAAEYRHFKAASQVIVSGFIFARSLYELGHLEKSKEFYDSLLAYPQIVSNGDVYWILLFDRGRIFEAQGNRAGAIELYKRAIEIIEEQRASIKSEAGKIGFVGDKQAVYRSLILSLFAEERCAEAFEYVERSKARALVDLLASKRDFVHKAGTRSEEVKSTLTALAGVQVRVRDATAGTQEISRTRGLILNAKKKLSTQAPELASLVAVTSMRSGEIQSQLAEDEILVEYYRHGEDLVSFVVTRDAVQGFKLVGRGLADEIAAFRNRIADPKSEAYMAVAQGLYGRLFKPFEDAMKHESLLIVPHGPLHYLPFNALHTGEEYLIERYRIRVLPSASVMRFLRARETTGRAKNLMAIGNPDLGDPEMDLAFAQEEAISISRMWPETTVLLRKEATETLVKKKAGGFGRLHFATHGQFDEQNPLNASGLQLAADRENDGFLSAGELYTLNLNADLVTLSACETAMGKIANGDDVIGLTRGFLYAGVNSIVSSLWSVDDRATQDLMLEFYRRMQTTSTLNALREAQLATMRQYHHPFYWASFQLVGNPH
jgi:CHAT domain-containing protein